MEKTAFEALMIGVNVFVFIIALTAGVMLMTSVIDMVNYANENAIIGMNGSLAENVGHVSQREYDGYKLLSYYKDIVNKEDKNILYYVRLQNGQELEIENFINTKPYITYVNEKFELKYKGKVENKSIYVFVTKENNEQ